MPTFAQTQSALLAALPAISAPISNHRGLVVEIADQRVYVTPRHTLGEDWISVAAIVSDSLPIRAETALRYNSDTPQVGALSRGDGVLQLREVLPPRTDTDTIVRVITALAVEAGRVRTELLPSPTSMFSEWAS